MKKALLAILLACLTAASLRADVILYESFNYNNGPIIQTGTNANGSTNWFRHSGSASPSDALVNNHHLENSATGGSLSRQDDVHINFSTFTNTQTVVYGSFTVHCTNLPTVTNYFAHFYVSSSTFHARVFAQPGTLAGTWRLGISGVAGTPSRVFQQDLTTNIDYQVVVQWDPVTTFGATLWVNPITSSDVSVASVDSVTAPAASIAYAFRQGSSAGSAFFYMTNLAVATTFDEAATNVWSTNAVAPIIAFQPTSRTNFVGDSPSLTILAAGQSLATLNYQWRKNGANFSNPNGNTNVLTIFNADVPDTGSYDCVVSTLYGLSVTSSVASLLITNAPVPPTFSLQPSSSTNYVGANVTLHVVASGAPPLSYAWMYDNAPISSGNVSGDGTDTLTITGLGTNNGTAGTYRCDVTNPYGTTPSSNAIVTVIVPPTVSIAFLRTLVDPVTYLATNLNLRYTAVGTVTTLTNLTTGNTASYYIQDSTAGINIFVTSSVSGPLFRPNLGDQVTFSGLLSSFSSNLELDADASSPDPTTYFSVTGNGLPLPAPKVIPFTITNSLPVLEATSGSLVMLTNVFFTNPGAVISTTANTTTVVTDAAGDTFTLQFVYLDADTAGQTLPAFAWSVTGVLNQNLANTTTQRNQGFQVTVTRFSDIVTNPPPAVTALAAKSGNQNTLSWTAVPYSYSYSVLAATNVAGPYLPLATGLTFTGTAASYTDTNATGSAKFYQIVSP